MQSGKDTFITLQRKPIKLLFYTLLGKDAGKGQNSKLYVVSIMQFQN